MSSRNKVEVRVPNDSKVQTFENVTFSSKDGVLMIFSKEPGVSLIKMFSRDAWDSAEIVRR